MACGTPVVCSNRSSLPEVVDEAGILVDPTDRTALATAIRRVLADDALRADLKYRALARAQLFSWNEAAKAVKAVYQSLYAS
jgi:glycosyltransferase involved in cell wall biosynthesis